jgi:predicted molibdopterin-dependent oxidoreductase YjgC
MSYMDMMAKCQVLYIVGANPMASAPNTNQLREMLASKEFLVVQDIFVTETAELAHVVLPAAAWAEKDGTVTEIDRRVQRIGKAVDPPGQARRPCYSNSRWKAGWWTPCWPSSREMRTGTKASPP